MAVQSWKTVEVMAGYNANKTRLYAAIAAILVSNFMTALDSSFSSSAHVAIASHFHKTNVASWPVTAFLICSITTQPLYASLSDFIGRRIIFLSCATLFLVGITLSVIAPSWVFLILARCICGLAASGLMVMGSVVLTDMVGVKKRGYYQSINYVNFGTGSALGSVAGGAIVERFGWRWLYMVVCPKFHLIMRLKADLIWYTFQIQVPFCIITLSMVYFFVPSNTENMSTEETNFPLDLRQLLHTFDWKGALFLVLVLGLLMFVLGAAGNVVPWTNPFILLASALFPFMVYLLARAEVDAAKPILPPILAGFPFRNIMMNAFLLSMINYIIMYNATFFFQSVLVESATLASTHLVVPSIAFTLISAISGTAIARLETPKPTLQLSQFLLLGGAACLLLMPTLLPSLQTPGVVYSLCLAMPILGVGMMAPSALLLLLGMSNRENHATMNGGFIMMRSLGGFTATSVSTTVVQNIFQRTMRPYMVNVEAREKINLARLNIDSLRTLEEPLRGQVIHAYKTGFTALFGLIALLSILIFIGFIGVTNQRAENVTHDGTGYEPITEMEEVRSDTGSGA
ncbi:major facilitator superfamily domain-containing protein [Trichoderma camerunense]